MEIEKFQKQYKEELNKKRVGQTILSVLIISIIALAHYFFEFDPKTIEQYINLLNVSGFVLLILIWKLKFAGGIKCPQCQHSLGQIHPKSRFQKRCCGNCGLLLLPEQKLITFKSKFMEQRVRPGFRMVIIAFAVGLVSLGVFTKENTFIIAGVASFGFIWLVKFMIPPVVCKGCGYPNQKQDKFCVNCGEKA